MIAVKNLFLALLRRRRYIYAMPLISGVVQWVIHRQNRRHYYIDENLEQLRAHLLSLELSSGHESALLNEAKEYLENIYSLFGSEKVKVDCNRWNQDFKTGHIWPSGKSFFRYKIIDYSIHSDIKYPWDFSRCHHFLVLGQAYHISGDEIFAYTIKSDIIDFIQNNPYMRSVNWTCTMDVAIRAANWINGIALIYNSKSFRNDIKFQKLILDSLLEHKFYIEHNFEKFKPHSGNHYIANLAGLLYLYFVLGINGPRFKNLLVEFEHEVINQVMPSGFHFEMSTSYHKLVLEMLINTYLLLKLKGITFDERAKSKLKNMAHILNALIKPDGNIPFVGDNDNGRFLPFKSVDYSNGVELLRLCKIAFPDEAFDNEAKSSFFPDARFMVIRNNGFYATIHNNPISRYKGVVANELYGTHTHCDMLSFTLSEGKRNIIIDPGTFCYTSSTKDRFRFRSTRFHNTLCIDDRDQQRQNLEDLFTLELYSFPSKTEMIDDNQFEGAYDYIDNNKCLYTHQRRLSIMHNGCELQDNIIPHGTYRVRSHFYLSPSIQARLNSNCIVLESLDAAYDFTFSSNHSYKVLIDDVLIAPSYGRLSNSKVIVVDFGIVDSPISINTYILKQ